MIRIDEKDGKYTGEYSFSVAVIGRGGYVIDATITPYGEADSDAECAANLREALDRLRTDISDRIAWLDCPVEVAEKETE